MGKGHAKTKQVAIPLTEEEVKKKLDAMVARHQKMDEEEAERLGEELKEALKPYIDDMMKSVAAIWEHNDLVVDYLLRQQNTLALAVANLANGSRPGAKVCMNEFEERARELPDKLKGLSDG